MFYHFLYPLKVYFSPFNLFQYITFRTAGAAITALLISLLLGPRVIAWLKRYQIGEEIRNDGPARHQQKKGTPTMGGVLILISILLSALLWANLTNTYIIIIILTTIWMGIIGFVDDYLKNIKKYEKGLIARYKLAGQGLLGLGVGLAIYLLPEFASVNTLTTVPFFKNLEIDFRWFYIPMVILVVTGTSNSVNLTDGLDGLASGLLGISITAFGVIAYISGRVDFSRYLNIMYLPGAGELTVYSGAFLGAVLGFLWYNARPAEIFMGDTGSLSLGSILAVIAILVKKELLLPIIGGVFVMETLSVIIQTSYFKWTRWRTGTGRRVFLMAPIHHHFELKGWAESKIVIRFWIIGILCALFSLTTFKIR